MSDFDSLRLPAASGHDAGATARRARSPGKSTLTSRLPASPASIARAVVTQLRRDGIAGDGGAPVAPGADAVTRGVAAIGDQAAEHGDADPAQPAVQLDPRGDDYDAATEAEREEVLEPEPEPQAETPLSQKVMAIVPRLSERSAQRLARLMDTAMQRFGIQSPAQQAMFLAQSAHETGGYADFTENGTDEHFDAAYAGKNGNGGVETHDGSRYRGRGAIQITGRGLYRRIGARIGVDLEEHPERAAERDLAFVSGAAYWTSRRGQLVSWVHHHRSHEDWSWLSADLHGQTLNQLAELGTGAAYDYITVSINPGISHENLGVRHAWFARAAAAFGLTDDGGIHAATQPAADAEAEAADGEAEAADGGEAAATPDEDAMAAPVQQHASGGDGADDPAHVHELARAGMSGSGGALPHLDAIQRAFGGFDVGDVVAHVGGAATAAANGMGALAYASGGQVAFGGAPDLHTAAHEAAHVVQQRAGVSLTGGVGQAGDHYEHHADAVADAVVRGESAVDLLSQYAGGAAVSRRDAGAGSGVSFVQDPDHTGGHDCGCRGCADAASVQRKPAADVHADGCDCAGCGATAVQRKPVSSVAPVASHAPGGAVQAEAVQRTEGNSLAALLQMERRDLVTVFTSTERTVSVPLRTGEQVAFTRAWARSDRGVALLRGEIRHAIQAAVHEGRVEELRAEVASLVGDAARIEELASTIERAEARRAEASSLGQDDTATSSSLVERGRQGRTMERRGVLNHPLRRRAGESDAAYAARTQEKLDEVHSAMDVGAREGTAVYAPIDGEVIWAGPGSASGGYGNFVRLVHAEPPPTQIAGTRRLTTHYCHLQEVLVSAPGTVHAGQAIGLVGHTRLNAQGQAGGVATDPPNHVHFAVQIAGEGLPETQVSTPDEVASAINPGVWLSELGVRLDDYRYERPQPIGPGGERRGDSVVRGALAEPVPTTPPPASEAAAEPDATQLKRRSADRAAPVQQQPTAVQRIPRPANLQGMASFCGVELAAARGVVPELRGRLQRVHDHFQAEYDALPEDQRAQFPSLSDYVGVTTIAGWREPRTERPTRHSAGEAVDVNYRNQPYIVTRTPRGAHTAFGGEADSPVDRAQVTDVYDRAIEFMRTEGDGSERADVGNRRTDESATDVYRRFRRTSDALRDYLSLAFRTDYDTVTRAPVRNPEASSDAELLAAIPTTERKEEAEAIAAIQAVTTSEPWLEAHPEHYVTAREVFIGMLRDYEIVRVPMERDASPSLQPRETRNPANGFLQLSERFVVSMMEIGGLRWGACEFGPRASGDVHHFDLGPIVQMSPEGGEVASPRTPT